MVLQRTERVEIIILEGLPASWNSCMRENRYENVENEAMERFKRGFSESLTRDFNECIIQSESSATGIDRYSVCQCHLGF